MQARAGGSGVRSAPRARRMGFGAFAALAVVLVAASCSTTPPSIAQTFWQLNLNRDAHGAFETLSVFVDVRDDDGIKDLDTIYVLDDSAELFWKLDAGSWDTLSRDGQLWVGSNALTMPSHRPLPRGTYRILVTSLSGAQAQTTFDLATRSIDPASVEFPAATLERGSVTITSAYRSNTLWFYNRAGDLVSTFTGGPGKFAIASIIPSDAQRLSVATLSVYAFDDPLGCGVIGGPYAY